MAEVDEEEFVDQTSGSATSSTNRVTPAPPGLSSVGSAQSHDVHDLHVDGKSRPLWQGATEHVCGPYDFTDVELKKGATTRAQDCDWRAVETLRYEDRGLPVSRSRTSSGLHSCRREATSTECLVVDGQGHRNTHTNWQAGSATI